jgi:serine/threonine-protein kinase
VHRDVSPSNVFLTYNGEVKLLDFGIAKSAGAASATQKGTVKGKIGYGAPEQFLARPVDARADIFAVGVMLWEALAGRRRKQADTPAAAYEARVGGLEPKIREVKPDVPARLADICDRATADDPGARFASALQFQRALERYLETRSRPVGQRDVATLVNYHFRSEREQMRHRIESQLTGSLAAAPARLLTPGVTGTMTPVTLSETASQKSPGPAPPSASVSGMQQPPPRAAWATPRALIAGGATLVAGGLIAVIMSLRSHPVPPAAGLPQPPVTAPAPGPAPFEGAGEPELAPSPGSVPRGTTVQLTIAVEPRDATVTLDGRTLAHNPFQGEFPLERRTHVVQATAPGFAPAERVITFAEDTRVDIALVQNRNRRPHRRPVAARPSETAGPDSKRIEPGMELRRPPPPAPHRQIDEKDPYAQ